MSLQTVNFDELEKIWKKISRESTAPDLNPELEIHQKLLNFFQVGDYYFYIFNYTNSKIEFVSSTISSLMGYKHDIVDTQFLLDIIHPEDLPHIMNIEYTINDFFNRLSADKVPKYKVRYDYRIRKSSGQYIRILQQTIPIQTDDQGAVLRVLCIHTDISHLKDSSKPVLSFIGLEGEPSFINQDITSVFLPSREILSKREKQVLLAMIGGSQSKDIATQLNISKETVDRHRKNMLIKTGARSTAELVALAIREGWI
ncbi:LuxR C-terminal-related transcriptional regulator [Telluribacter sp. SYSU D00476]|uniref:LuxR C-terminal-related transcriptional regulator n=1 Tax=Telluribacter sp. SYSU D00476 TaxID=2811430 RepID=UPI001FF1D940|nr:LuxR C-terminal-related transcriptional regulator [Telluribacter sp. SYSU D00476]